MCLVVTYLVTDILVPHWQLMLRFAEIVNLRPDEH